MNYEKLGTFPLTEDTHATTAWIDSHPVGTIVAFLVIYALIGAAVTISLAFYIKNDRRVHISLGAGMVVFTVLYIITSGVFVLNFASDRSTVHDSIAAQVKEHSNDIANKAQNRAQELKVVLACDNPETDTQRSVLCGGSEMTKIDAHAHYDNEDKDYRVKPVADIDRDANTVTVGMRIVH